VIGIVGLGRIGLILASAFLNKNFRVVGYDIDPERILENIYSGSVELHPEEIVREIIISSYNKKRFSIRSIDEISSEASDIYNIIVPVNWVGDKPDFESLKRASEAVGDVLSRGDLVIVESSVPPGTTRGLVAKILEKRSGLVAGRDFGLAYSPERVSIGRGFYDLTRNYPKIIAGIDNYSLEIVSLIYSEISEKGVLRASSLEVAEFEKLAEGIYRDVNIALANSLAEIARRIGLDFWEIRELANSQPYSHIHTPGVGVGGVCLPYYPKFLLWYLSSVGEGKCWCGELIALAREINTDQPRRVVDLVLEGSKIIGIEDLYRSKVCVLGLSYRGDIPDTRESPTYHISRELVSRGFSEIVIHDPFVARDDFLEKIGVSLTSDLRECLSNSKIIISATDHGVYKDLSTNHIKHLSGEKKILIIDGRNIIKYSSESDDSRKCLYGGIGKKWMWC